ncbi:MAG: glycoside hydrolase family 88 protein [Acidobacteria bacterium]|nr:glycoside hydrolase family 88 protein [Acidobacteriota bacterium]
MKALRYLVGTLLGAAGLAGGCGGTTAPTPRPVAVPGPVVHAERWPVVERRLARDGGVEQRVGELLSRMSVEEKVGQVIQAELQNVTPEDVRRYHLGSVLNGGGSTPGGRKRATAAEWLALADAFFAASMDTADGGVAVPVIWGTDAVHGHNNVAGATVFPHNIGLGAARDPELVRRIGEATAKEVAVTGLDWTFAPTVAVARDDRWGRTYEAYAEDPELVREYAAAIIRGLQGDPDSGRPLEAGRVVATAKHFLGDGGTEGGRNEGDNLATEEELVRVHAAGYVSALEAGAQTVMASFSSWHGRRMHGFGELLTGVLKGRMGFDGFVVGDWNGHAQLPGCTSTSCPQAFNAGVDMFMAPEDWQGLYHAMLGQVRSGAIPSERLDDAVRRIVRVKLRAGLFERGRPSSRPFAGRTELLGAAAHRAIARQVVRESLVLLKNRAGLLPLRRDLRVLVAGPGADDIGRQCGGWTLTWQGDGNTNADFPGATSIWEGIRQAVEGGGGSAVLQVDGVFAERPDVAIVVYGEDPYAESRGDRATLEYRIAHPGDVRLLRRLSAAGVPVVSVFLTGRPQWVNPELNASDAFVVAWLPGSEGAGVADVLFRSPDGAAATGFTGKLSFSWPKTPDQTTLNRGDEGYDPLFPYGFGLASGESGEPGVLPEGPSTADIHSRGQILSAMSRVADWQLANLATEAPLPDGGSQEVSDTEWVRGAFFAGVMAAFRTTANRAYLDAALGLAEKNGWQPGPRPRHADDLCIAQTYAELFLLDREERRIQPTVARLDAILAEPRPGPAVGWREDDNWSWCDALFMAPPTMAMIGAATGDRRYFDAMGAMWWETSAYLYDQDEHLWYRDGRYVPQPDGSQPRTPNGRKVFWSRGNGWVFAGLARVLEHLPADHPDRPRFERQMREMAAALVAVQGADGLWRSSLLDRDAYPAPETSGSGFFAYGLAWGINHGVLDAVTYLPAVRRAWRGLDWALQPSGKLGWVQQIGYDPRSVGADDNQEYGAGAFLLAASELVRLAP